MAKGKNVTKIKDVLKEINDLPELKKLPSHIQKLIKKNLQSITEIQFPIATFRENKEWIAKTPLIDISAQGETEEKAIESIIDMIDDYMSDPYTKKPCINTIVEAKMKIVSVNVPIDKVESTNPICKKIQ